MAQTIEELQADRTAIAEARLKFLRGEQVKEVSRAGRRMVMATASLGDFDAALAEIDRQILDLSAATAGARRRRAFSLSFG